MKTGIIAINICNSSNGVVSERNPLLIYWDGGKSIEETIEDNLHDYLLEHYHSFETYFGKFIYYRSLLLEGFKETDAERSSSGYFPIQRVLHLDEILPQLYNEIISDLTDNPESVVKDTVINYARSLCHDNNISLSDTRQIIDYINNII